MELNFFFVLVIVKLHFCKVFLTKRRCQLQSLELCFTTHPHWTAHTSVIKDRKLLAIEKYSDPLQNVSLCLLSSKKKNPSKKTHYHDCSSMCRFFLSPVQFKSHCWFLEWSRGKRILRNHCLSFPFSWVMKESAII